MDEKNNGSHMPPQLSVASQNPDMTARKSAATSPAVTAEKLSFTSPNVAQEVPISERREAYGTATTENLRDSGLWRILLPAFVALCCLALLAIPLIFLIPLFFNSLDPNAAANQIHITWLWIVLILINLSIAAIVIRGLIKIFMTQAGNYGS